MNMELKKNRAHFVPFKKRTRPLFCSLHRFIKREKWPSFLKLSETHSFGAWKERGRNGGREGERNIAGRRKTAAVVF